MFQLCERISAFAYGKLKLKTVDACLDLSEALPISISDIIAAPDRRSVAMHGGGQKTSQSHNKLCIARMVPMITPCAVTLPFICRGGAIKMEGSGSSLGFVTKVSSGSKLPPIGFLRWHRVGRKNPRPLQTVGALLCFHNLFCGQLGCCLEVRQCTSCRYKDVLATAAGQIGKLYGTSHEALVLNLGPAWLSPEAYGLFNNNVIEIPFKDWESPPGLGICPLGVIFTVCSSIASWLALNEDNVVVSHTTYARSSCHMSDVPPPHHAAPLVWVYGDT